MKVESIAEVIATSQSRKAGLVELFLGGGIMTTPLWDALFDQIVVGAHAVAAFAGAIMGLHGVWRILRGRGRGR